MTRTLAEVCEITMGQAPTGDSYNDQGEGLPLIAGAGDFNGQRLAPTKFTTKPGKVSKAGDIVVSIRASIGAKVWSDGEYCLGRGVAGLRPRFQLDDKYLWHWLTRYERELASKGRGATFLQVNKTDIGEMPIQLPPLDEQRRIAAILDQADVLRAKRQQALAHLNELRHSVFSQAARAGDPQPVSLADAGVDFVSGKNLVATGLDAHACRRVIKVSAVSRGVFDPVESKPLPRNYDPPESHRIQRGDILFGRASGSIELLGATVRAGNVPGELFLPDKVWRAVLKPGAAVGNEYLLGILQSQDFKSYVQHHASGAAGVRNIGKRTTLAYQTRLPSADVQAHYAAKANLIHALNQSIMEHGKMLDSTAESLATRAFRGDL